MDTCVRCGAELGVGRFCLNCGHPIGEPAPPVAPTPLVLPVQAADPVPAAPVTVTLDPEPAPAPVRVPEPETVQPAPPRSEWDPREDLLPYEDVDDPEPTLPGRAWIAWVLGAVLLVGLVVVLLQVLGTDDEEATASDPGTSASSDPAPGSASPEDESSEAPTGVGKRIELATGATFAVPGTAPPTTDLDGNLVAYEASQMQDGNPSTTWRTAGDATGQTITVTLPQAGVVQRVGLVNGYSKVVAGVDWYPNNRRILSVTWGFDDGSTLDQTFAERPGMQRLKVPPVETATVTITITSVTPPGTGSLGRDYTAISEVSVIGRRAG